MRWVIGATTVTLISAGAFVDDASLFFPGAISAAEAACDKVTLALNCLLLESGGKRIQVDTGFGDKPGDADGVDLDPATSARTRRSICQKAVEQHSIVILTHDATPGWVVRAEGTEQEFRFVPIAASVTTRQLA